MATSAFDASNRDRQATPAGHSFRTPFRACDYCENTGLIQSGWKLLSQPPHGFLPCVTAKIRSFVTSPTPCSPGDASSSTTAASTPQGRPTSLGVPLQSAWSRRCHHEGFLLRHISARPNTPGMGGTRFNKMEPSRVTAPLSRQEAASLLRSHHQRTRLDFRQSLT